MPFTWRTKTPGQFSDIHSIFVVPAASKVLGDNCGLKKTSSQDTASSASTWGVGAGAVGSPHFPVEITEAGAGEVGGG